MFSLRVSDELNRPDLYSINVCEHHHELCTIIPKNNNNDHVHHQGLDQAVNAPRAQVGKDPPARVGDNRNWFLAVFGARSDINSTWVHIVINMGE